MSSTSYVSSRLDDVAVRTERGAEIIRREPREIPRRLRGLLLAIDGRQTIRTYIEKLDGFGDVEALLSELATLGLLELRSGPRRIKTRVSGTDSTFGESTDSTFGEPTDSTFGESTFSGFAALDAVMGDRDQLFETFAEATVPGTFDDLVRVAQIDNRDYMPPASPPPPAPGDDHVRQQVDSLFSLLEAVRNERKALRGRLERMHKYRAAAEMLTMENQRLLIGIYALAGVCALLIGVVVLTGICS